jgi:hypothetical protein
LPSADAKLSQIVRVGLGAALLCLAVILPSSEASAGEKQDDSDLRRTIRELLDQNRELSRRLDSLEGAAAAERARRSTAKPASTSDAAAAKPSQMVTSSTEGRSLPSLWETRVHTLEVDVEELEANGERTLNERVKHLEISHEAHERATRQIIQDTLAKAGPQINSHLLLSGVVEFSLSRSRGFASEIDAKHPFGKAGPFKDSLTLSSAELEFEVRISNWLKGSLVVTYENGSGIKFPTTTGTEESVDRMTLNRSHVLIGDETLFPILARVGLETLHFGTSTGVARLDTLSIGTPMTTEVFENRQIAGGFEFALPTPPLGPPPAPVVTPPVQPLVVAPFVSEVMRRLGYKPLPERVLPLAAVRPPVDPPPLYGSIMFYKGSEDFGSHRTRIEDFNASLGFRTKGHCGVPYEELTSSLVCPWTFDFHVDYSTSVFESKFLHSSYRPFLIQIGSIPGMAASIKTSFGPFAVVGELNTAIESARFVDGLGIARDITPMTWQASLAYQFNWNPWVREIGAQGDFISVAYSGSHDLAGVQSLIKGVPNRVGFVPASRLLLTVGEWVMPDLKLAAEYSINWDYTPSQGGTGQRAYGVFGILQFNF